MSPLQVLRVAVRALLRNKLRSFLTTLGVIIGVSAVIAMVAIGEGAKARVEEAFASMGSNLLVVLSGTTSASGAHGGFGSMPTLTWDDLKAIRSEASAVRYASPQLRSNQQVISEDQNWATSINGVSPEYFLMRTWPVAMGSPITQSDIETGSKVVAATATTAIRAATRAPRIGPTTASIRTATARTPAASHCARRPFIPCQPRCRSDGSSHSNRGDRRRNASTRRGRNQRCAGPGPPDRR